MLCIPLAAATNAEMSTLLERAHTEPADLLEFRFDYFTESPHIEKHLAAAKRPVIATCRSLTEGGRHQGGREERLTLLHRAMQAGAEFVDCEAGDVPALADHRQKTRIIASLHDFSGMPPYLDARVAALAATSADWVKFAVMAHCPADNLRVFAALGKSAKPAIGIAMGLDGLASRILGPRYGSQVTFGSLSDGLESAPGQPTAREMAEVYRVDALSPRTEIGAFLADADVPTPLPDAWRRAYFPATDDKVCVPFYVTEPGDFFTVIPRALGIRQILVSERHGRAALAWAAKRSDAAAKAGRANRLVLRDEGGEGEVWVAEMV